MTNVKELLLLYERRSLAEKRDTTAPYGDSRMMSSSVADMKTSCGSNQFDELNAKADNKMLCVCVCIDKRA